jgi:very-short-patch-repair endonuclease
MSTLVEKFIFNNTRTSHKRWESMVMYSLHYALRDVEMLSQHSVGPYLIDGYFPELNLAIEIDEPYHERNKEEDHKREAEIKLLLGCEFFRIDVQKPIYSQVDELVAKVREKEPTPWVIKLKVPKERDGMYSQDHLTKLKDANAFEFIDGLREEVEKAGIHTESGDADYNTKPSNGMISFIACFDGLKLTVFTRASCKPKIIVHAYNAATIDKLGIKLSEPKNPNNPYWKISDMDNQLSKETTLSYLKELAHKSYNLI